MSSLYSIFLFVTEQLVYLAGLFILLRTYQQTKYPSHILLGISFSSWILNSIIRFVTSFFEANQNIVGETGIVTILWGLMNVFLIIGLVFIFYAFIFFKTNSLHPIINLISFLGGALIYAFIIPEFTTLEHNENIGAWSASYEAWVTILIVPLLIFFLLSFIVPITNKLLKSTDKPMRRQLFIQILGLVIVILWAFFAGFTNNTTLRLVRPFLLPVGWLIWSITLVKDPFNIMASNAEVTQLLITTEHGLPIYYNDFMLQDEDVQEEITADLASGLIAGVTQALEKMVEDKSKLSTLGYKDKVIGITSMGFLRAYVFGERFDKALETVLNVLLQEIQESSHFALQITPDFVDLDPAAGKILQLMIESSLKRVLVL